jgi:hypothetical protein
MLGVTIQPVTSDLAASLGLQQVRSVADLQASLRRTGAARPVLLLVRRGDASLFLTVRPRG